MKTLLYLLLYLGLTVNILAQRTKKVNFDKHPNYQITSYHQIPSNSNYFIFSTILENTGNRPIRIIIPEGTTIAPLDSSKTNCQSFKIEDILTQDERVMDEFDNEKKVWPILLKPKTSFRVSLKAFCLIPHFDPCEGLYGITEFKIINDADNQQDMHKIMDFNIIKNDTINLTSSIFSCEDLLMVAIDSLIIKTTGSLGKQTIFIEGVDKQDIKDDEKNQIFTEIRDNLDYQMELCISSHDMSNCDEATVKLRVTKFNSEFSCDNADGISRISLICTSKLLAKSWWLEAHGYKRQEKEQETH